MRKNLYRWIRLEIHISQPLLQYLLRIGDARARFVSHRSYDALSDFPSTENAMSN